MATYGALWIAPYSHFWFKFLDRLIPLEQKTYKLPWLLATVAIDQLVSGPLFIAVFFSVRGVLEKRTPEQIKDKIHTDLFRIWSQSAPFWCSVQCLNMYFVPLQFRVLFSNCNSLVWNTYVATIYKDNKPLAPLADPAVVPL